MWPFTKKKQPELSCIAKSILNDLSKYPNAEWDIEESEGYSGRLYQVISHRKVSYKLFTNLMDIKRDYVSILGVHDILSYYDQCVIFDKLRSFYDEREEAERIKRNQKNEEKLKELFPQCYEKS